jgi:ABC-type Fe3+ transport system permease subunit
MIEDSAIQVVKTVAQSCQTDSNFLSFPTWYKYLSLAPPDCEPTVSKLTDFWLVLAALLEILIRLGAMVAVGFIIWGSIRLIVSQGEPNSVKDARNTIINAVIGLVITVLATIGVSFLSGRF